MNAQITSARGIKGGRRGMMGQLGKGPVVGVAIGALIVGLLIASSTLTHHGSARREADTNNLPAFSPLVSTAQYDDDLMAQQEDSIQTMAARVTMRRAAVYYDDLMSQQEDYIHTMATRAMMRRAAAQYDDLMTQQEDYIHTMSARWHAQAAAQSEQQRLFEASTTAADTVTYYRTIDGVTYDDRLLAQGDAASTLVEGPAKSIGFRVLSPN